MIKPYSWAWTDGTAMDIFDRYCALGMRRDCLVWTPWNAAKLPGRDEPNNLMGMCVYDLRYSMRHTVTRPLTLIHSLRVRLMMI
jgi:hypothetical protein